MSVRMLQLVAENEALRYRVQVLEEEFGVSAAYLLPLDLTRSEATVLGVLMKNRTVRKSGFMIALYGDRIGDPPDIKIIDVVVCKTRKKLAQHGIEIKTVWGIGYEMPEESKVRARELITYRSDLT
jgi:two-component system cell cycle response regulator CtrA